MAFLHACLGLFFASIAVKSTNIPGHNKPLGSHKPPEGPIELLQNFPSPLKFYEQFVLKSKAVLFKGVCKDFSATKSWTDRYLRDVYGRVEVSVDHVKVENRFIPSENMELQQFLDIYNDTNVYLIDTLPKEMRKDFDMPNSLLCGEFAERIQDIVIWFNSGKSKSHLHMDTVENINCMVSGAKNWFLVDKENTERVVMDHQEGDYCSVDVDKVDMKKYPFMQTLPWWNITVEQGDCIYIPYGWAHQVSSNSRNIAINVWWTPMLNFNQSNCKGLQSNKNLVDVKFTPGEQYRFQLLRVLENNKGPALFSFLHSQVVSEHTGKHLISFEDFKLLDGNNDGHVDENEIRNINLQELETIFDGVEPGSVNIKGLSMKINTEDRAQENLQSRENSREEL